MSNLLNTREAAAATGSSISRIVRLAQSGVLPATKLPGRTGAYVFQRVDVEALAGDAS